MEIHPDFLEAYKAYPGSKSRTHNWNRFIKHSDWKDCLPLLIPAIETEKEYRIKAKEKDQNRFVPPWKNFATWLNQRCWEQEFPASTNNEVYQEKEKYLSSKCLLCEMTGWLNWVERGLAYSMPCECNKGKRIAAKYNIYVNIKKQKQIVDEILKAKEKYDLEEMFFVRPIQKDNHFDFEFLDFFPGYFTPKDNLLGALDKAANLHNLATLKRMDREVPF